MATLQGATTPTYIENRYKDVKNHPKLTIAIIIILVLIIAFGYVYYRGVWKFGPYVTCICKTLPKGGGKNYSSKTDSASTGGGAASAGGGAASATDAKGDPETEKLINTINSS